MHYALIFLPGLFIAIVFAIKNIITKQKFIFNKFIIRNSHLGIILFVFTVFYFSIFLSPVKNILFDSQNLEVHNNTQDFIKQMPPEASLVSSASLAPALSNRTDVYLLQYSYLERTQFYLEDFIFPEVDYILIDTEDMLTVLAYANDNQQLFNREFKHIKIPDDFRQRLDNYVLIKAKNNLLLWQNKKLVQAQDFLPLYEFIKKPQNFAKQNFIVSTDYLEQNNNNILSITYQSIALENKDYLVRFYSDDYYFDVPLDYGLYPVRDWPANSLVQFYYYLTKDIKAYQLLAWQGNVKLGPLREAKLDLNLKPISDKINFILVVH